MFVFYMEDKSVSNSSRFCIISISIRKYRMPLLGRFRTYDQHIEEIQMDSYIDSGDDLSKLLMSIGSISKGFGGQGQRMGETASFNVSFRQNADPEIRDFFLKVYGEHPEKISFFLPCSEIDKCITAPYTAFNAGKTMLARSDGEFFTYIANLDNPMNTAEPYMRDGKRCSDGQAIPHRPNLGFLGKPNIKMQMSGQIFVFIKELLEAGVFQTMAFKFHTRADRDMLRKRLCFIRDFASGINVPLTAIPMFLTKYKKMTCFIDQNGVPRRSEHFYLDLGLVHFIGTDITHPFSAAFSSNTSACGSDRQDIRKEKENDPEPECCPVPEEIDGVSDAETEEVDDADDEQEPESRWQDDVVVLSDDLQKYILDNVSACGSRYGIKPSLLENYRDKNGTVVSELSTEELLAQIRKADDYLLKIMHREITVDRKTETKAKMRRWALIMASLIKQNKYAWY